MQGKDYIFTFGANGPPYSNDRSPKSLKKSDRRNSMTLLTAEILEDLRVGMHLGPVPIDNMHQLTSNFSVLFPIYCSSCPPSFVPQLQKLSEIGRVDDRLVLRSTELGEPWIQ